MYIYKITHKSTHQAYVGQTGNPFARWQAHCQNDSSPIQKAIREEGIHNFTFEVLEKCEDKLGNEREAYWINYFHTYENGYNTNGGNITTPSSTSLSLGAPPKPQVAEIGRGKINSPDGVDAYDPLSGKLVAHYASIAEANRALGKEGTGNISAVCRGKGKTAYGYIWRYSTPQTEEAVKT